MSKRTSKPEKLGPIVESLLKELGLMNAYKQHQVLLKWPEAAGEIIAEVTSPEKIEFGRLYVKVKNSSWKQELHFHKAEIINRLNEISEGTIIKEIVLI